MTGVGEQGSGNIQLSAKLLCPETRKRDLIKAMENHILGQAELMGKYGR